MSQSCLNLKVYSSAKARECKKSVFERQLYMDNSILFPFNKVTEVLHLLFGQSCVITIESSEI